MPKRRRKPPIDPKPASPVRPKPSLDFSMTGLVYCSMMMFMGLAAINTQANLLFGVFGLMIGVLVVSGAISRIVLRKLKVERALPESGTVGTPVTITYEFANTKRYWPSVSVAIWELDAADSFAKQPVAYMLHAAHGASAVVPTEVLPVRRGLVQFDEYQLSTSFPFGFIKRAVSFRQTDTMLVYPAIGKVDDKVLEMCQSADKSGATMRPRRGGMDEFYGVKEFRQGENPRWIYWRRSARTGVLVAKEMTQVSPPKLLLLIDTFLPDRTPESHAGVERAIAMAASLANHALESGLSVGLFAWSEGWLGLPPNRGKRQRRELLSALAQLPLNTRHPSSHLLDNARPLMKSGTTPVLLTAREGELSIGEAGRAAGESGRHRPVVISAASRQGKAWFTFPPDVEFAHCMPTDQRPGADIAAAEANSAVGSSI